jgi:hypothetical protein
VLRENAPVIEGDAVAGVGTSTNVVDALRENPPAIEGGGEASADVRAGVSMVGSLRENPPIIGGGPDGINMLVVGLVGRLVVLMLVAVVVVVLLLGLVLVLLLLSELVFVRALLVLGLLALVLCVMIFLALVLLVLADNVKKGMAGADGPVGKDEMSNIACIEAPEIEKDSCESGITLPEKTLTMISVTHHAERAEAEARTRSPEKTF